MNRTKIEYADCTWNPCTGCLGPRNDGKTCSYCYARRIAERFRGSPAFPNGFDPTFHPERLCDPDLRRIPAGSRIFVGSMTDLGAPWAAEYMPQILEAVETRPDVTFIFLTKQAEGFVDVTWPDNCWVGITVEGQGWLEKRAPTLLRCDAKVLFVSIEPLLAPIYLERVHLPDSNMNILEGCGVMLHGICGQTIPNCHSRRLSWVVVGAQTGPRAMPPDPSWVERIDGSTKFAEVPLFMKSNLRPYWDGKWRQEYPK